MVEGPEKWNFTIFFFLSSDPFKVLSFRNLPAISHSFYVTQPHWRIYREIP